MKEQPYENPQEKTDAGILLNLQHVRVIVAF
jgi:hypothetical protein